MKLRSILALVASIAAVATLTALPADAAPRPQRLSQCGQTITARSAYLARDLVCATGFRTRVTEGRRALTLDLRGHRLQGTGSGTPFVVGNNDPYFDSLTVRNGRVDHWGTAFRAAYATLDLRNVQIDHNDLALACGASTCTVTDTRISDNTVGTTTNDAALVFSDNVFSGNGVASDASTLIGASSSSYTDNVFSGNAVGVRVAGFGSASLTQNVFQENGVGLQGLATEGPTGYNADLDRNSFVENTDGVHLVLADGDDSATLTGNLALRNTRYGFYAPGAVDADGNQAAGNGEPCVGVVCSTP